MNSLKSFVTTALAGVTLSLTALPSLSADLLSPEPIAQQAPEPRAFAAVDGLNWQLSILGGALQRNVLGTASNGMVTASVAAPLPYFSDNFGVQLDLGAGIYDGDFTSAASGLHIFYRDPNSHMLGIYGDWAYTDPEHGGRVGVEFAKYSDRWTFDALASVRFGQHFKTQAATEVDLSYYFTDNFKASIGHRFTARGHLANVSFESLMPETGINGLSVFGEIEAGEDNFVGGFAGVRFAFGSGPSLSSTLIDRDRQGSVHVRIPRNLVSVSQCGNRDVILAPTSLRSSQRNLCASEEEVNAASSTGITKQ